MEAAGHDRVPVRIVLGIGVVVLSPCVANVVTPQ